MSNSFPASDESVKKATGKSWNEWIKLLDKRNASKMVHKDIVNLLYKEKIIKSSWWCQMVTNGYERAKGKREAYSSIEGYQVSVGKTYSVDVDGLFDEFKRILEKDLVKKVTITKFTKPKSIRAKFDNGKSRLSIGFYNKGKNKSQIAINHEKLSFQKEVEEKREFWKMTLDKLL